MTREREPGGDRALRLVARAVMLAVFASLVAILTAGMTREPSKWAALPMAIGAAALGCLIVMDGP